ncbi:MAG: Serine/threonine protein kinase PrkC, regulator of stationary phase [Myxococcaceae bacterium]|nr:Serine/threonine protein kinase PrkC, regulator of stationary phase [Myxococcaceae bacterium]
MNALEPGSTLGGYRILARLRAGAMGVLYLARRIGPAGFSRPVAIKVIHDHLAANKRFARMFVDEAKLSARIDDPNVVRVEEFGQADGRYYLVMEYVHGASLAQTIAVLRKRGRIPIEQAVAMAMQIAGGLHGAHEATDEEGVPLGVVHRDVSPHNVIVSYKGSVRVIDFGIAKARQVGGQTKTGSLRGKLAYMPPEQARSARTVDRRADLYGVGLVLWEMLTFRRVFDADTDIAILNQIRNPEIIPPSALAPAVPKALDDVIMRTLANDPAQRPATGAELQRALADALPAALRVLPGDIAGLMKKVRAAADAVAGKSDDPSASYGEEVRGTLRTFGASMHDSVELADALDTRPSSPDLGETARDLSAEAASLPPPPPSARPSVRPSMQPPPSVQPPSVQPPRMPTARMSVPPIIEDETTMKRTQPVRSSAAAIAMRPGDGVRPLASRGSSPDLLVPPAPLSSARGLGDIHAPRTSSADLGIAAEVASLVPPAPGLAPKQKVMLAVGAPLLVAMIIAFAILAGGRNNEARPSPAARPPRDAAAPVKSAPESPALVAPVVIAPPENDDVGDAGAPGEAASAGARAQGRGKKPLVHDDDPYALLMQDGGPARARRVLEERGVDKLTSDELRVLRSICRAQKDAACLSRVAVQMDRHP